MEEKKVLQIELEDVLPNRFQPRLRFHEVAINELAESIKKHGVIQPIVVRPIGDKYEIIAGERRYKASQLAGKKSIPAIIADLDDRNSAEVALIENVQREDLTPIEEAISYKKILDMGYLTQTELATKLGKEQSTVANKLRLLNLHEDVQEALLDEEISERHARSLLKLNKEDQAPLLKEIIAKRLTVRKTDQEIDSLLNSSEEEPEVISFDFGQEDKEESKVEKSILNPGFVDVDKIEAEAEDIFQEKPEKQIENLLNNSAEEEPKAVEEKIVSKKFFHFFPNEEEEETPNESKVEDLFNFEVDTTLEDQPEQTAIEEDKVEEPQTEPKAEDLFNFEAETTVEDQPEQTAIEEETPNEPEIEDLFSFEEDKVEEPQTEEKEVKEEPNFDFDFELDSSDEKAILEKPVVTESEIPDFDFEEKPVVTESEIPDFDFEEKPVVTESEIPDFDYNFHETQLKEIEEEVEEPKTEELVSNKPKNVMGAVSKIREFSETVEKEGFTIDIEEFDFEDMYQMIIKINKG